MILKFCLLMINLFKSFKNNLLRMHFLQKILVLSLILLSFVKIYSATQMKFREVLIMLSRYLETKKSILLSLFMVIKSGWQIKYIILAKKKVIESESFALNLVSNIWNLKLKMKEGNFLLQIENNKWMNSSLL